MPDENRSLRDGAVSPWAKSTSPYYAQTLEALGKVYGFKLGDRFSELQQGGAGRHPARHRLEGDHLRL